MLFHLINYYYLRLAISDEQILMALLERQFLVFIDLSLRYLSHAIVVFIV